AFFSAGDVDDGVGGAMLDHDRRLDAFPAGVRAAPRNGGESAEPLVVLTSRGGREECAHAEAHEEHLTSVDAVALAKRGDQRLEVVVVGLIGHPRGFEHAVPPVRSIARWRPFTLWYDRYCST